MNNAPLKFAVYALIVNRKIAYIGMTSNIFKREDAHRRRLGTTFSMRILSWHQLRSEAARREREMIEQHQPKLNRDHVLPRKPDPSKMMPADQAKALWRGRDELTNAAVLRLMKGWTYAMAYDRFGARGRPEQWK